MKCPRCNQLEEGEKLMIEMTKETNPGDWRAPDGRETIIVTRHPALVTYLEEIGMAGIETDVYSHVTPGVVRDRHVIGVLPLHLAAEAASVTEVPLDLTPEMRGKELTLAEIREIAGKPVTYLVCRDEDLELA